MAAHEGEQRLLTLYVYNQCIWDNIFLANASVAMPTSITTLIFLRPDQRPIGSTKRPICTFMEAVLVTARG